MSGGAQLVTTAVGLAWSYFYMPTNPSEKTPILGVRPLFLQHAAAPIYLWQHSCTGMNIHLADSNVCAPLCPACPV